MKDDLAQASELAAKLKELSQTIRTPYANNIPRSGDDVAVEQMAVFGQLLVVLARYMDTAQRTIKNLTWAIFVLTAILAFDELPRLSPHIDALLQLFNSH
jgi:hypothetical protein